MAPPVKPKGTTAVAPPFDPEGYMPPYPEIPVEAKRPEPFMHLPPAKPRGGLEGESKLKDIGNRVMVRFLYYASFITLASTLSATLYPTTQPHIHEDQALKVTTLS